MTHSKYRKERGFALVTALLIIAILIVILVACMSRLVVEYRLASKFYDSTAALNLAEAGIERILWLNPSQDMHISPTVLQTSAGRTIGYYDVAVSIAADGLSGTAIATGYVPNTGPASMRRTIKVTFIKNNFSKAVLSLNSITMSGQAKTDSYDSSLGAYNCILPGGDRNVGKEGDIATNGTITLSGQVYINGDANPGPDHPLPSNPNPATYISGKYGTLQAPMVVDAIPAVTINNAKAANSNGNITITHMGETTPYTGGNSISVSGQDTMTLSGGTYYFTSVSTSGQGRINVTGPTVIFVDGGNINISGQGIVNSTNNSQPKNLQVYATGSTISLSGQAAFYGAIYAPAASVTLSGQENFYGAIVCGSDVDSGQSAVHFDINLTGIYPVFEKNYDRVNSWQDIS